MKRVLYRILCMLPHHAFELFGKCACVGGRLLSKADFEWLEKERIRIFARELMNDFDGTCRRICKKKRIMVISKGMYGYSYLNNAYISNVMSLIVYALYRGYIPEIRINSEDSANKNNWDWYFEQPMKLPCFDGVDFSSFCRIECDRIGAPYSPWMDVLWNEQSEDYKIWRFVFRRFIRNNKQTLEYLEHELGEFDGKKTMGLIIRGTDYTSTKPKYHPVQPELNELIDTAKIEFGSEQYDTIYVATEEKKLFDAIADSFDKVSVVTKQKMFYDEIYYENFANNVTQIGDVKFQRENDNYLKGLEYLLTLNALSRCACIVGGNCGGTLYAVLMSEDSCKHQIFNLGVY